jgi:uncharacterized protein (TIGR02145 family)
MSVRCVKDEYITETSDIIDNEGNSYKTIGIGTQTWMAENLKTTKYNDGTAIPNVTDGNTWFSANTGAQCTYKNTTNADTISNFGRLYNWHAVNTGKICPIGWHVPSKEEWSTLNGYLTNAYGSSPGEPMASTMAWASSTVGIGRSLFSNNKSGFTALPGGLRGISGTFSGIGQQGYWWNSSESDEYKADNSWLSYDKSLLGTGSDIKQDGLSVRCLKN